MTKQEQELYNAALAFGKCVARSATSRLLQMESSMTATQVKLLNRLIDEIEKSGEIK